jgi:thiazole/oxazole-forming peptide maturase SagD family component
MLYSQQHLSGNNSTKIRQCVPLDEHLECTLPIAHSPFVPKKILLELKKKTLLKLARWCQKFFRVNLYVENYNTFLFQLSPETRSLLTWLIEKKILEGWWFSPSVPGYPVTKVMILKPAEIIDPNGSRYHLYGSNGVGTGETCQEASLPALGELIERLASAGYWWENNKIFLSEYKEHQTPPMIHPGSMMFVDKDIIADDVHAERYAKEFDVREKSIQWCPGIDFIKNDTVYIPAAACYMFAQNAMLEDPYFPEVSSNGVAAHTDYYEACTRAILEYMERDNLMRAWYHKRNGKVISLESLSEFFPDAKRIFDSHTFLNRTYVIDMTDDLKIPTIVGVRIDNHERSRAVHFTASAELDYDEAVRKCLKELIRFSSSNYHLDINNPAPTTVEEMRQQANSIKGRGVLWSHQEMVAHLEWFVQGPQITYDDILKNRTDTSEKVLSFRDRYKKLRDVCRLHSIQVYLVEMTNSVARHAGLRVVRALSPDLVPVFFDERYMPIHHTRFSNSNCSKEKINPIPHPFL